MKQSDLILSYLKEHDSITPARMTGKIFMGTMFGSEISRVCRTLRAEGKLQSERVGKFEKFYITKQIKYESEKVKQFLEEVVTPKTFHMRFDEDNVMRRCTCPFKENH